MNDEQLLRYSRHILLEEIGPRGQAALGRARVLVIGAGGLGSPVALYLASAGVGEVTLVDDDVVDLTNLQRQIAHTSARIGQPKVESAKAAMTAINPEARVIARRERADAAKLDAWVAQCDLAVDCCDNFATRQALNAACVRHGRALVWGAAVRFDAQLGVFDPRVPASPCYSCIFPPDSGVEDARCATLGVFAPLVGIVGSLQAAEALKWLAGTGRSLSGRMLMLDARSMEWSDMAVARDAHCPVCALRP